MPSKPYHKKWLSISETRAGLTADSNAKADICNAIADERIRLSFLVPQLGSSACMRFELEDADDAGGAKSLAGIPVQIPGRLPVERFADLSQPIAWWWPWFFRAVSQRPDLAGFYWGLAELELLAADVKKVLGGVAPSPPVPTSDEQEQAAIEYLAAQFRQRGEAIKRAQAQSDCCRLFGVTKSAVRYRIWSKARTDAGLPPVARHGRKPKSPRSAAPPSGEIGQNRAGNRAEKKESS